MQLWFQHFGRDILVSPICEFGPAHTQIPARLAFFSLLCQNETNDQWKSVARLNTLSLPLALNLELYVFRSKLILEESLTLYLLFLNNPINDLYDNEFHNFDGM